MSIIENIKKPYLIKFNSIGAPAIGYISVAEQQCEIPFDIKRVYWTYFTPERIERGGHANIEKELVLVAVAGSIIIETETITRKKETFQLNKPNIGLYIPSLCWHKMKYTHNAVQMVVASNHYSENDYIRDYSIFLEKANV
ncbi:MAG: FdtA/QdtA family cupin domain-containing protein [Bacteroidales bacterium]|nr:FdtA/QdtA family cupin domain-containing protein [Bacteroidales bacterium]